MRRAICGVVSAGGLLACSTVSSPGSGSPVVVERAVDASPSSTARPALRVLLFSRTTGYRHAESIAAGQAALRDWAEGNEVDLAMTEDAVQLTAALPERDVVVFLNTTGDVLDAAQERAFEAFVRAGGGFVGVHSASGTEYDWPFYAELIGAWFESHPAIQPARIRVEAAAHPVARDLPDPWERSDEWYNFRGNPRVALAAGEVVLTLDESSYEGGTMGADHPIAWSRRVGAGRAFYTALGHAGSSWEEPLVRGHIQNAVLWVGGRLP
jgi:type 1 glutamine amidotransferase